MFGRLAGEKHLTTRHTAPHHAVPLVPVQEPHRHHGPTRTCLRSTHEDQLLAGIRTEAVGSRLRLVRRRAVQRLFWQASATEMRRYAPTPSRVRWRAPIAHWPLCSTSRGPATSARKRSSRCFDAVVGISTKAGIPLSCCYSSSASWPSPNLGLSNDRRGGSPRLPHVYIPASPHDGVAEYA